MKTRKGWFVAIGILVLVLISVFMVFRFVFISSSVNKWQEQYDLGVRYLSEGKYEEAILAFTAAIEIDSKQVEPYIGLSDSYVNIGEFEKAEEILRTGYDATGDEKLAQILEAYENGSISTSDGRTFRTSYYNGDGMLTSYIDFTYIGNSWSVNTATSYDANGNLTGFVQCTNENGNSIISYIIAGRYDGSYPDGLHYVEKVVHEYNENGQLAVTYHYEADGSLCSTEVYSYDQEGREIERIIYNENGLESWKDTYEYPDERTTIHSAYDNDSEGVFYLYSLEIFQDHKVTSQSYFDESGNLTGWAESSYDELGRFTEWCHYDSAGVLRSRSVTEYKGDSYMVSKRVDYDGEGNITSMVVYD